MFAHDCKTRLWDIYMMTSFDYNYHNAFRCNVCNADLCHVRLYKRNNTEHISLPQSILVVVVKWRHHANVYSEPEMDLHPGTLIHVHPDDLELHLAHSTNRNTITASNKQQQLLLEVKRKRQDHIPEIPAVCKLRHVSQTPQLKKCPAHQIRVSR